MVDACARHHHKDAGDGHEDVGNGHHRLVCRDGQSHGGGRVGDQNHGEHEEEEGGSCRLQTCTQIHTITENYGGPNLNL